jgi:hypothetical protein
LVFPQIPDRKSRKKKEQKQQDRFSGSDEVWFLTDKSRDSAYQME